MTRDTAAMILDDDMVITTPDFSLTGSLILPRAMSGLVVFVHGSGSSRLSPRNRLVAGILNGSGIGTLLIDLLTAQEAAVDADTAQYRFNIPFLARRLEAIMAWVERQPFAEDCPLGLFGASTGAAAAMIVAAHNPNIAAVVSRGGRPDLAADALEKVTAPVLLMVGSEDTQVLGLNRRALKRMSAPASLDVISGAGHLFEENDSLEIVARHAAEWFRRCFKRAQSTEGGA